MKNNSPRSLVVTSNQKTATRILFVSILTIDGSAQLIFMAVEFHSEFNVFTLNYNYLTVDCSTFTILIKFCKEIPFWLVLLELLSIVLQLFVAILSKQVVRGEIL